MSSSLTTMNDEAQGRLARAKQSFLRQPLEDGTTSASDTEGSGSQSDSYSGHQRTTRQDPNRFKLWHTATAIPEDDQLVITAVEELGETYSSGRINRLEFQQRTALVEQFAKHKVEQAIISSAGSPFTRVDPGDEDRPAAILRVCWTRCWRAAIQATRVFTGVVCCGICTATAQCCGECIKRLK